MDADKEFSFYPDQASTFAPQTDALYTFLWGVTVVFTIIVAFAVMYLAIRYRRGNRVNRKIGDPHGKAATLLEITWSVIPLALTMVMFVWGAALMFRIHEPPADTMDIYVLGKQWMWKFQHPNGKREINDLHIPVGQPIKLKMISEDVIHSMYFPAFRVKQDVLPGRYTQMWFEPTKVGVYHIFCAEYCGTSHSEMIGKVHVMSRAEYAEWLEGGSGGEQSAAEAGREVVERNGCISCHKDEEGARAPSFTNLYGRTVTLKGGGMVTADDEYIRESIYDPREKMHAGYQPIMPVYTKDQISEEQVLEIIAYLKSISQSADGESEMNTEASPDDSSSEPDKSDPPDE